MSAAVRMRSVTSLLSCIDAALPSCIMYRNSLTQTTLNSATTSTSSCLAGCCAAPRGSVSTSMARLAQGFRSFASEPAKRSGGWGQAAPMSMKTLIVAMMAGAGLLAGTNAYKESKMQKVMQNSQQVVGKASVGGAFELVDSNGKKFTDQDLLGEFALLYFGFTFCPDICPDELEKIAEMVNAVEKQTGVQIQPVFISVDPERDTPSKVKEYVKEFHPRMIGLTGDMESVKRVSKLYRVYFSKTGESSNDYLVDHSIIHYLINPAGEFVTFYSKAYTAEQLTASVIDHMAEWKASHTDYHPGKEIQKLTSPVKPLGVQPTAAATVVK